MAALYSSIGKKVNKFLKEKTYRLRKTGEFTVASDDNNVVWKNETTLKNDGRIDSSLNVTVKKKTEKYSIETSTTCAPEVSLTTTRGPVKDHTVTFKFQDPVISCDGEVVKDRWAEKYEFGYDYSADSYSGEVALSYKASDKVLVGVLGAFKNKQFSEMGSLSEYAVGAQFDRTQNHILSVKLANCGETLTVGNLSKKAFKNGDVYAEFNYGLKTGSLEGALGYCKKLDSNSNLSAVLRTNQTASLLIENSLPKNKVKASVACNYDMSKQLGDSSLEWKLVFG